METILIVVANTIKTMHGDKKVDEFCFWVHALGPDRSEQLARQCGFGIATGIVIG